jgi:hypothetical protein
VTNQYICECNEDKYYTTHISPCVVCHAKSTCNNIYPSHMNVELLITRRHWKLIFLHSRKSLARSHVLVLSNWDTVFSYASSPIMIKILYEIRCYPGFIFLESLSPASRLQWRRSIISTTCFSLYSFSEEECEFILPLCCLYVPPYNFETNVPIFTKININAISLETAQTSYSLTITVFCVVAPCSLIEVYRRFRGACCFHRQGMAASTSETPVNFYQITRRNNSENTVFTRI